MTATHTGPAAALEKRCRSEDERAATGRSQGHDFPGRGIRSVINTSAHAGDVHRLRGGQSNLRCSRAARGSAAAGAVRQ